MKQQGNYNFTLMGEDMDLKMEIERKCELKWNHFYPQYYHM